MMIKSLLIAAEDLLSTTASIIFRKPETQADHPDSFTALKARALRIVAQKLLRRHFH